MFVFPPPTPASVFSLGGPLLSLFSPSALFLEGSNLSQLLSVSCHAASCVCVRVCVMRRGFISFLYQPSGHPPLRPPCCLFSFFPYFHTLGHTCSPALSHTFPFKVMQLHLKHLCKQKSGIYPLALVDKGRLLIPWLAYCLANNSTQQASLIGLLFPDSEVD